MAAAPFVQSPAVAAVFSSTSLSYAPSALSAVAEITVTATVSAAMAVGDSVQVVLASFGGATKAAGAITAPMMTDPGHNAVAARVRVTLCAVCGGSRVCLSVCVSTRQRHRAL